jgi:hypothetical protein
MVLTVSAQQWEVLCACTIVVDQGWNVWPVRVDGRFFRQQVLGNLV